MYLHNHMKPTHKIKKNENMFHYSMLVTKESNNKIHDNDTILYGKGTNFALKNE